MNLAKLDKSSQQLLCALKESENIKSIKHSC